MEKNTIEGRAPLTDVRHRGRPPKKPRRKLTITVAEYKRRTRLLKVYELVCMNERPIRIAEKLNISPATVTKYMNRLRDDAFLLLLQNKEAQQRIAENIARWNNMIGEAYKILTTTTRDDRKLHAIKTIADIIKKIADYEVLVGKVRKAPDEHHLRGRIGVHSVDIDSIRDEVSQEDLDKTILAIAEALKKREKLARGKVIEVPPLPESNGEVEKAADETPNAR